MSPKEIQRGRENSSIDLTKEKVVTPNPNSVLVPIRDPSPIEGRSWVNVVTGGKLNVRGMDWQLTVPQIKDGEKIVQLALKDIKEETMKWKIALIMYVVGNSPFIGAMERFLANQWKFVVKP